MSSYNTVQKFRSVHFGDNNKLKMHLSDKRKTFFCFFL